MRLRHIYLLSTIAVFLVFNSCSIKQETESEKLHNLFNDFWEWGLQEFPTRATYLGDYRYNDQLTDMSLASIQRRHKKNETILRKLEKMNREQLDPSDKLNYDLFHKNITRNLAAHPFKDYLMPVDQMGGLQINFPNLVDINKYASSSNELTTTKVLIDSSLANGKTLLIGLPLACLLGSGISNALIA